MRRTTLFAVAATTALSGCFSHPSIGGNVANGDSSNHPSHPYDARVAGSRNPTGNQSGPWVGETGIQDATTGINDRVGEPSGERMTTPGAIPQSSRNAAPPTDRIETTDEQTTPVDMPKPDPTR
ncbi:MAG TPA: hypothetical protein VEL07_04130, partial [Planctomycetota bacterium]|nr:hypothetical protein [Planctomycetota bacterium]